MLRAHIQPEGRMKTSIVMSSSVFNDVCNHGLPFESFVLSCVLILISSNLYCLISRQLVNTTRKDQRLQMRSHRNLELLSLESLTFKDAMLKAIFNIHLKNTSVLNRETTKEEHLLLRGRIVAYVPCFCVLTSRTVILCFKI